MIVQTVLMKLGNLSVPAADRKSGVGTYDWRGVVFNSCTVLCIRIVILSYSSVSELKLIPSDTTTRFYCTNKNKPALSYNQTGRDEKLHSTREIPAQKIVILDPREARVPVPTLEVDHLDSVSGDFCLRHPTQQC